MRCHRCQGSMIQERFYGPGDPFWGWKCIACGEIWDEVILENRGGLGIWQIERHQRVRSRRIFGR
jgi:hypothetical protein